MLFSHHHFLALTSLIYFFLSFSYIIPKLLDFLLWVLWFFKCFLIDHSSFHRDLPLPVNISRAALCLAAPRDPMDCGPPGTSIHGASPGNSAGVGGHALLQGVLPTRGLNPGLAHSRWILYRPSH